MQRCDAQVGTVRLRPVEPGDLPVLFEMQSEPESNALAGTKPRSREVFFAAWERNLIDPGVNARVIEVHGSVNPSSHPTPRKHFRPSETAEQSEPEIVGSIARFQADGHDCVGYWIARTHWGRGFASRALALFLAEERRRPLHATSARTNAASHRILEKCGFRCVGFRMSEETERYLAREIADFVLE